MVETVALYRAPTAVADVDAIAEWLAPRIDADVIVREPLLEYLRTAGGATTDDLAHTFAEARVLSPYEPETGNTMLGIVRYEERALEDPSRAGGVLYAGQQLQRALNGYIPTEERSLEHLHVPLLDRALATWGEHDGRWHKRVNVLGQPGLISVPGLYEAPAKPEAYYKEKQRHALLAGDAPPREVLENEVEGEFLIEDDPRTTDALKGYVLQALHLLETGEGFCENEGCRLANPHRQPGVIAAQLSEPAFCSNHAERYDV